MAKIIVRLMGSVAVLLPMLSVWFAGSLAGEDVPNELKQARLVSGWIYTIKPVKNAGTTAKLRSGNIGIKGKDEDGGAGDLEQTGVSDKLFPDSAKPKQKEPSTEEKLLADLEALRDADDATGFKFAILPSERDCWTGTKEIHAKTLESCERVFMEFELQDAAGKSSDVAVKSIAVRVHRGALAVDRFVCFVSYQQFGKSEASPTIPPLSAKADGDLVEFGKSYEKPVEMNKVVIQIVIVGDDPDCKWDTRLEASLVGVSVTKQQ